MHSSNHREMIRVLLADRTRMAGQMVSSLLRRDKGLDVIDATGDPGLLNSLPVLDVALISSQFESDPGKGFELLRNIRGSSPRTRIVMMLDSPRRELVIESFRAGARGIFCRTDSSKLLPKCIRCVHGNQIWANAQELEFLVEALGDAPVTNLMSAGGEALLSTREQQVVRFVAEGLGNREIAKRLDLSEHTVKNYMFRIFNKLRVSSRVEVVLYAASRRFSPKSETFEQQKTVDIVRHYGINTVNLGS